MDPMDFEMDSPGVMEYGRLSNMQQQAQPASVPPPPQMQQNHRGADFSPYHMGMTANGAVNTRFFDGQLNRQLYPMSSGHPPFIQSSEYNPSTGYENHGAATYAANNVGFSPTTYQHGDLRQANSHQLPALQHQVPVAAPSYYVSQVHTSGVTQQRRTEFQNNEIQRRSQQMQSAFANPPMVAFAIGNALPDPFHMQDSLSQANGYSYSSQRPSPFPSPFSNGRVNNMAGPSGVTTSHQRSGPTSYASVAGQLGLVNDTNSNIERFCETVFPASRNPGDPRFTFMGTGSRSDAEILLYLDHYFRSGEFRRRLDERTNADQAHDDGLPLGDFLTFMRNMPESSLQDQSIHRLWVEPRNVSQANTTPEGPRENQHHAHRPQPRSVPGVENYEPFNLHEAHRGSQPRHAFYVAPSPEIRHYERVTAEAIKLLKDVPINSLPEEDRSCSICMELFGDRDPKTKLIETPVKLPCGHIFGCICIKKWFEENCTCPICRRKLESEFVGTSYHAPRFTQQIPPHIPGQARTTEQGGRGIRHPNTHSRRRSAGRNRYEVPAPITFPPTELRHYVGENEVPPTIHPRLSTTRPRANALSTRSSPSAARSLYIEDAYANRRRATEVTTPPRSRNRQRDSFSANGTPGSSSTAPSAVEIPRRPASILPVPAAGVTATQSRQTQTADRWRPFNTGSRRSQGEFMADIPRPIGSPRHGPIC